MSPSEQRRRQALRALLALLAISAGYPGLWATLAPGSFYAAGQPPAASQAA